jgi:hypothetical protein
MRHEYPGEDGYEARLASRTLVIHTTLVPAMSSVGWESMPVGERPKVRRRE